MVFSEVEFILKKETVDNVEYSINVFNTLLNEVIARGTDIRFLNFSLSEIDTNPVFEEFINRFKPQFDVLYNGVNSFIYTNKFDEDEDEE